MVSRVYISITVPGPPVRPLSLSKSSNSKLADSKIIWKLRPVCLVYVAWLGCRADQTYPELRLETAYWAYMQAHPNHKDLPEGALDDATEALVWCHAGKFILKLETL